MPTTENKYTLTCFRRHPLPNDKFLHLRIYVVKSLQLPRPTYCTQIIMNAFGGLPGVRYWVKKFPNCSCRLRVYTLQCQHWLHISHPCSLLHRFNDGTELDIRLHFKAMTLIRIQMHRATQPAKQALLEVLRWGTYLTTSINLLGTSIHDTTAANQNRQRVFDFSIIQMEATHIQVIQQQKKSAPN